MSNKLTNWHDAKVRKPAEGERVLVVRKSLFWDTYYVDLAKYEGGTFRCDGTTPTVTYWSYLPDAPDAEDKKPMCKYCGSAMERRSQREMVDEERYVTIAWYECPCCGATSPRALKNARSAAM